MEPRELENFEWQLSQLIPCDIKQLQIDQLPNARWDGRQIVIPQRQHAQIPQFQNRRRKLSEEVVRQVHTQLRFEVRAHVEHARHDLVLFGERLE
jgi:hypothetical protein